MNALEQSNMRQEVFSHFNNLKDLDKSRLVCKTFNIDASNARLWTEFATILDPSFNKKTDNVRKQVHKMIISMKKKANPYTLPADIKKIVDDRNAPSFENIILLKEHCLFLKKRENENSDIAEWDSAIPHSSEIICTIFKSRQNFRNKVY